MDDRYNERRKRFNFLYDQIKREMIKNFPEVKTGEEVLKYMNEHFSTGHSDDQWRIREDIATQWGEEHLEKSEHLSFYEGDWHIRRSPKANVMKAAELAKELHEGQIRKRTGKSYYDEHLSKVADIVEGITLDLVIVSAALLHDAIEDQPSRDPERRILEVCGQEVLDLVRECTEIGPGGEEKAPWLQRKKSYLEHLSGVSAGALLISIADKLQSARDDLVPSVEELGDDAYNIFKKAGKDLSERKANTLWFHRELANAFDDRYHSLIREDHQDTSFEGAWGLIVEFESIVDALAGTKMTSRGEILHDGLELDCVYEQGRVHIEVSPDGVTHIWPYTREMDGKYYHPEWYE